MSTISVKELSEKYREEFEDIYKKAYAYSLDLKNDVRETLKKVKENKSIYKEKAIVKSNEMFQTFKNVISFSKFKYSVSFFFFKFFYTLKISFELNI